jgi:single-strand DNA-binding protein
MQKVILIGNLGKDPEVKSFENGGKIANFTVGVTERGYKTKDGKEIPDHTEWFNCSVRQNGLAGVVEQYVKKGNKVYVEGKLRTREYEKDGQKKYLTELLVDNMELLTPKGEGGSQQPQAAPVQQQAESQDDSNLPF